MTPSSRTFSAFASSVAPVVVMSTMSSAWPAAGAPSVAPRALDDAVIADVVRCEEAAGQIHVLRRDAHALSALDAVGGGNVLEIDHAAHVDPGARHRHDDIGVAEAERRQQLDPLVGVRNSLAHEILARDAHVNGARGKLRRDLTRREERDLDIVEAFQGAAIIAYAAPAHDVETGAREKCVGIVLQPPLRGHGKDQRRARTVAAVHCSSPVSGPLRRSSQMAAPTAGMSSDAPSKRSRRS